MRRSALLFIKAGLLVAAAVWIAANPGQVSIVWGDWIVEADAGIALVMVLVLAGIIALIFGILPAIRWVLGRDRERRAVRRRAAAYTALTGGMVAIAAGDARRAAREIGRLDKVIDNKAYVHLLTGQAAQLRGDEAAAVAAFEALSEDEEASFLGQRGLIVAAIRLGTRENLETALILGLEAFRQYPRSPWLLNTLGQIYCRTGRWAEAQAVLEGALKRGLLPPDDTRLQLAAILEVRAGEAEKNGDTGQALNFAKRAHNFDPSLTPATVRLARLELTAKHRRRVRSMIERVWSQDHGAHTALADIYVQATGATGTIARFRVLEGLHALNPASRESALILAEAAIEAGLIGNARAQLDLLAKDRSSARVVQLMARMAVAEGGDEADTSIWLKRVGQAATDPAWICAQCHNSAEHWRAVCPICHNTGQIHWVDPAADSRGGAAHAGGMANDLLEAPNVGEKHREDHTIAPAANSS